MAEGLTVKQRRFIDEYLTCWNATEAARRVEYAHPNKQGPANLVKLGIREEIERRMAEHAMPAVEVLARLTEQARADIRDLFDFDDDGKMSGLKLHRDAPLHLIRSITPTRQGIKIEVHDQQGALALLAKAHGLLVERLDVNDVTDYADVSPNEQIAIHQAEIDRLAALAAWDATAAGSADAESGMADQPAT